MVDNRRARADLLSADKGRRNPPGDMRQPEEEVFCED